MKLLVRCFVVLLVLIAGSRPLYSGEGELNAIYAFGDSLTDTGNAHLASLGTVAPPPYYWGRFSNGPVWVEELATRCGLPAPEPSIVGGTNYAWGGATSGSGFSVFGTPNLGLQVQQFLADGIELDGDELLVVWIGANDVLYTSTAPWDAARNVAEHIETLALEGGRVFLVPNLPPIGQTPMLRGTSCTMNCRNCADTA
jgi:thermolabile hemolysin